MELILRVNGIQPAFGLDSNKESSICVKISYLCVTLVRFGVGRC